MSNPATVITISDYMRKPEHLARFSDILGKEREGQAYVQSVLIAVSASPELMKCTPQSIMRAALRAASLGLSCDPALKQAWLVPYNKKQGDNWVSEAQFQPHYKGLYTLAMRTGKYWQINVSPVDDGQRVLENTLTGLHAVREDNGNVGLPSSFNSAYTDVTVRRSKDKKVIGWIGYFKTKKGFEKSVYMSSVEIDDHARKYVKGYEKNQNWSDPEKRQVMEMKTVLRQLLSWADMSGTENSQLVEALQSEEPIEVQAEEVTESELKTVPMNYDSAKKVLPDNFSREQLNDIYLSDATSDAQKEAARLILKEEYSVEPPQAEKRTEAQIKGQMGF